MTNLSKQCLPSFSWTGQEYKTCTINGPNNPDYLPQCMVNSTTWGFCVGKLIK